MPNKILLFRFWQLQKIPNFKRSYHKTSIMAREYSFHNSLQVMQFTSGIKRTYVTRYSKRYLKSSPLVSDLQPFEANQ